MHAKRTIGSSVAFLLLLAGAGRAASRAGETKGRAPAADRIPELARDLATRLEGRTIRLPGGAQAPLLAGGDSTPAPLLTTDRLVQCLTTLTEASAWPAAWLVVQDASRNFDLVLGMRLGEDGRVAEPDPVWTAPRREWDARAVEDASREATGKKPPRGRSVVVQSFSRRTETTYVYEPGEADRDAKGLLALLPKGSLIREAKRIDLGDGGLHTLALVLVEARFVPSDCGSCASRAVGHIDAGKVLVVLAGEKTLEDTLDLTGSFSEQGAQPFLPRYECAPGDEDASFARKSVSERFQGREPIVLLSLVEEKGDGKASRFTLPVRSDCTHRSTMVLQALGGPPRIRLREIRDGS